MPNVKILDSRRLPGTTAERRGKLDRVVTFQSEDGAVLIVKLPEETFSEAALREAVRKELDERGKLVGKSLSI